MGRAHVCFISGLLFAKCKKTVEQPINGNQRSHAKKTMTKRNRYDHNEDGRHFRRAQVCAREVSVVLMARISATLREALSLC